MEKRSRGDAPSTPKPTHPACPMCEDTVKVLAGGQHAETSCLPMDVLISRVTARRTPRAEKHLKKYIRK